jgi:hypothetical protein
LAEAFAREYGIRKTVILVPSGLRDAAKKRLADMLSDGWGLHTQRATVIGYQELSLAKNADLLERLDPDLVIADECHFLKDRKSARTKRFLHFMRAREKQTRPVIFVGMSGTLVKRTPLDYWELIKLSHGPERAPLPHGWPELKSWVGAIVPAPDRLKPGALADLMQPGEDLEVAFGRRVLETPGVVSATEPSIDSSLVCSLWTPTKKSQAISEGVADFEQTWEAPNRGPAAVDALSYDRLMQEVSLGFWSRIRFDSDAAADFYRTSARAWRAVVKQAYALWSLKLDSDLRVRQAIESGKIDFGRAELDDWRKASEIERETIVKWYDPYWLPSIVDEWAEPNGGIVWVERIEIGRHLSDALDVPYYGAGDDPEAATEPLIIVAAKAHGTGRNLQRYSRNLVVSPSPSGAFLEQLIGRTHRQGQLADEVDVAFLAHIDWARAKIEAAKARSKPLRSTRVSSRLKAALLKDSASLTGYRSPPTQSRSLTTPTSAHLIFVSRLVLF